MDKEFTPAEVAELCRVKVATVWGWIRSGRLPARKYGKQYRVNAKALRKFRFGIEQREE